MSESSRQPREERRQQRRPVHQHRREIRGEPGPVAVGLRLQVPPGLPVVMPHQRGRRVAQPVALRQDTDESVQIVTAPGGRPGTGGRVEAADLTQHGRTERHVGARAEPPRREREQRLVARRVRRVVRPWSEALREAAVALQQHLGRGGQPRGQDQPGAAAESGVGGEGRGQLGQPARVGDHVVVGEGDDLTAHGVQPRVVRACEPRNRLTHVPHALGVLPLDQLPRLARHGRVVDDHDLEPRMVLRQQRIQRAGQLPGPLPGGHDDTRERRLPGLLRDGRRTLRPRPRHEHGPGVRPLRHLSEQRAHGPAAPPHQHEHLAVRHRRTPRARSEHRLLTVQVQLGDLHRPDVQEPP